MGSNQGNDGRQPAPSWLRLSGIGIEFVGIVVVCALIGYWADRHWHSSPWGVIAGLVLGMIGSLYNLIRETTSASRQAREEDRADRQSAGPPSDPGDRTL
jgi:F0F1-type ATP synthase assembly protein I